MASVKEATPVIQSTITDDEFGGFRVTIPPRGKLGIPALVLCISLLVVYVGLLSHLIQSVLCFSITAACSAFVLLRALTGWEVVTLDGKTLSLRRYIAGISRARPFELSQVRNLRPIRNSQQQPHQRDQLQSNSVAFEYGSKTYHFGKGLSEIEVIRLVKTLRQRFRFKDDVDDAEPLPIIR
jgi:hypothetical protein